MKHISIIYVADTWTLKLGTSWRSSPEQ